VPLFGTSGHEDGAERRLLSGVKRTYLVDHPMSAMTQLRHHQFRLLLCNLIHSPIVSVPVEAIGKRRELDLETLERW
jgi:hypothetical protein